MKMRKQMRNLLLVIMILPIMLLGNVQVQAADSWDAAWSGIDAVYDGLTAVQAVVKQESASITVLRKKNNADLKAVNDKVKAIDKTLISRLAAEAETVQRKHAALLEQYSNLGKQITAAGKAKNTKSADLLKLKRNKIKPAVTSAKAEIKAKKDALTAAKKAASAKAKTVKEALAPVQTIKKQVTAENKTIAATKKSVTAANKRYKASVKLGDAIGAVSGLKEVYDQTNKIHASQQKIFEWEKKISQTISSAAAKLPK
ncbi:hypothetical protein [Paenibacillus sp. TH7-28]